MQFLGALGLSFLGSLLFVAGARADLALGGHFGLNLDNGHPLVGADLRVDVVEISDRVRMDVWPSYSHVFIDEGRDVELIEVNLPFLFDIRSAFVTPYVGPGLGISFSGDTNLKLNVVGGCLFHIGERVEPFTQAAIRTVDGVYVDLVAGLLVRL